MKEIEVKITKVAENSVLVFLPENPQALTNAITAKNAKMTNAYLTLPDELKGTFKLDELIKIPTGYTIEDMVDKNGEYCRAKNGNILKSVRF